MINFNIQLLFKQKLPSNATEISIGGKKFFVSPWLLASLIPAMLSSYSVEFECEPDQSNIQHINRNDSVAIQPMFFGDGVEYLYQEKEEEDEFVGDDTPNYEADESFNQVCSFTL